MTTFKSMEEVVKSGKKYDIIYADPCWDYKAWSDKGAGRTASSHYDVMDEESMNKEFDISEIANKNSVLFCWVTYPNLEEGLRFIARNGFKYKTCGFQWTKLNKKKPTPFVGMGYYTRANGEICLLATRGKPLPRLSRAVQQIVMTPIEKHSKKPDCIRDRIVALFGDRPRIELFARQTAEGWDSMGNEL